MAILRDSVNSEAYISYISAVSFFCVITCLTIMLKFGGFKASLNFSSKKKQKDEENIQALSINGAYRTYKDDTFDTRVYSTPIHKSTPSIPKLLESTKKSAPIPKPAKSTTDLTAPQAQSSIEVKIPSNINRETSSNVNKQENKNNNKNDSKTDKKRIQEQKKLDKKQLAEQKKIEKQAAQEQAKKEKLKKDRERQQAREAQVRERVVKKNKNKTPAANPRNANPMSQQSSTSNTTTPNAINANKNTIVQKNQIPNPTNSTNTLDSSISRSSGPPPYSETTVVPNKRDDSGNTSFGKTIDNSSSSWDLISQHRQQVNRPKKTLPENKPKQTVMDLNYNFESSNETRNMDKTDKSEA